MSIATATARNDYLGTGSVAIYPYTFKIFDEADLLVTQRDTSDVESTLVLNTDYTVDGIGLDAGGNVTLSTNLPSGYTLTIRRVVVVIQEFDFRNLGQFFAKNHENSFDYSRMIDQQQQDEIDRSLKLPETVAASGVDPTMPVPVAGETIKWNDAADALISVQLATPTGSWSVTGGNGILARTGTLDFTVRTIQASGGLQITNGDGVAGNPDISIQDLGVATGKIDDLAVTTAKIDDDAVTTPKLADEAVDSEKIAQELIAQMFQARLTFTSGTPIVTADQNNKQTTYLTPYLGDKIALYSDASSGIWKAYQLTEIAVAHPTPGSTTNYDVFVADVGAGPVLSLVAWTNDTTRATALATKDGVLVKTGDFRYRYCGTVRIDNVSDSQDTVLNRWLWNYYNRIDRRLFVTDTTATWVYNTAAWRQANANSANQISVVVGVSEDPVVVNAVSQFSHTSSSKDAAVGIGLDVTNADSSDLNNPNDADGSGPWDPLSAHYYNHPGIGYHYFAWVEYGSGAATTTFYGTAGTHKVGLLGHIRG